MSSRLREEAAVFRLAVQFLTRVPVGGADAFTDARLAATARYYPLVGVLIGAAAAAVFSVTALLWPAPIAVILSVAATLMLTGALHEDGFADACDGLGGGTTRERALEIMKDSRLGTHGVAGLVLMLGARIAALALAPVEWVPWMLIAGHASSRASAVLVMATSRYVRASGTATPVADGVRGGSLVTAIGIGSGSLLLLAVAAPATTILGAALGLAFGHYLMRRCFEPRLGGYTGDCLGAVQQTSELGLYLGVVASL